MLVDPRCWEATFTAGFAQLLPPRERLGLPGEAVKVNWVGGDAVFDRLAALDWGTAGSGPVGQKHYMCTDPRPLLARIAQAPGMTEESQDTIIAVVELLEHKSIFSAGYTAILHVHAIAEECAILKITGEVDKKTGKKMKKKPMFVKQGAVITCIIETEQVVCLEQFDVCPQLGRFTLRDEGKTIGIGKILDLAPDKDPAYETQVQAE